MNEANWTRRDAAVVWHGFTQMSVYEDNFPVIVDYGEGHELVDVDGNRYLDAISSLWVNTMGHRVPELDRALREQVDRIAHSTMLGNGNRVVIELAESLAKVVPVVDPHFLFASDGAASLEQALKIAFQHWANLGQSNRTKYLALGNAYHGDTIGSLALGAGGFGTDLFDAMRFPVLRTPGYDDEAWLAKAIQALTENADELAAVVIEPLVQGAAGMFISDPHDVKGLARACKELGVLLICDEVATGFGRTGALFASELCGIQPDLLCLGKGLSAGYLPMSVTVACGRVFDSFLGPDLSEKTFYHGHSYGGNALAAAVAKRHLELLEDMQVLANVALRSRQLGNELDQHLKSAPGVGEIRRCGLMTGVELAPPDGVHWGRAVCAGAVRRGVLLRPLGDVVVIMPPLTIRPDEITRIVSVLADSINEVRNG